MFKVEITLKELVKDYDWAQVFADENAGNVSKTIRVVPPGSSISDAPFGREDAA